MKEMLRKLAEASGWSIPDDQIQDITTLYAGTMEDTKAVRDLDLGAIVPAIHYKADE